MILVYHLYPNRYQFSPHSGSQTREERLLVPHPSPSPEDLEVNASALLADVSLIRMSPTSSCRLTTLPIHDGLEVLSWSGHFDRPVRLAMRDDSHRIHFTVPLRGAAHCTFLGGRRAEEYWVGDGSGSINYGPDRRGIFRQQGAYGSVTVMVRPDVFAQWSEDADVALRQALAAGACFDAGACGAEQRATAQALACALERASPRHALWLQSQATALVALFLEQRAERPPYAQASRGTAVSLQLQRARDLLLADLRQAPSIVELSRMSGLSILKLKRGFREHFGHSVYGLFMQERMHDARKRLLASSGTVMDVATDMGYSNASHFAAAFRKQFGINPSELKRSH